MNATDQYKLLKAGFTIIHAKVAENGNHFIECKTIEQPNWHYLLDNIKNKAELKRKMKELLISAKVVDVYDSFSCI